MRPDTVLAHTAFGCELCALGPAAGTEALAAGSPNARAPPASASVTAAVAVRCRSRERRGRRGSDTGVSRVHRVEAESQTSPSMPRLAMTVLPDCANSVFA